MKETFIIVLIIIAVFFWNQNKQLKEEVSNQESIVSDYEISLQEANDNIEELNDMIDEAQSYAWSSYEDMGYALDNLQTLDTVPLP